MSYTQNADGQWRYQYEPPLQTYVPVLDSDGNPTGNLQPSISYTPDGRPVATTPEQVAALMELQEAEPKTTADRLREFQIQIALNAAGHVTEDAELRRQFDMIGRMAEEVTSRPDEPVTMREQLDRVAKARRLADQLGFVLRSEIVSEQVVPMLGGGVPNGQTVTKSYLAVALLNSNGSIAYGPCPLPDIEVRLTLERRQREAQDRRLALMRDYENQKRDEQQRRQANSPEGRIAALEQKLAAATGEPAPEPSRARMIMPGVVVRCEINDVPVDVPL